MDDLKRLKYLRTYFKIAVFMLVLFSTSWGWVFLKSYFMPDIAQDDGLHYEIFRIPLALTMLLLLICTYVLYWSKQKGKTSDLSFVLTFLLTIPVAIFGFLMLFSTLAFFVKLFMQLFRSAM